MQILETHALSEREATELTVKYLNVEADKIKIKIHKKGSSGFFSFAEKKPNTYYVFAIKDKTPRDVVIRGVLLTILHKMGYSAKIVDIKDTDNGKVYTELASPAASHIIGRKGRTLDALQNMTNLLMEKFLGEPSKVILDIENYRDRKKQNLQNLAQKVAEQVEEGGRARVLDPLNPYERRIIHEALEGHAKVTTQSVGTGNYKKIRIKLINPPVPGSQGDKMPKEMYEDQENDNSSEDQNNVLLPDNKNDGLEADGNTLPETDKQPDDYNR